MLNAVMGLAGMVLAHFFMGDRFPLLMPAASTLMLYNVFSFYRMFFVAIVGNKTAGTDATAANQKVAATRHKQKATSIGGSAKKKNKRK